MIYINIQGGLGNQIFQSAFGLVVQEITKQDIRFLAHSFANYSYGFKYELSENFPLLRDYLCNPEEVPEGLPVLSEPEQYASTEDVLSQISEHSRNNQDLVLNGYWSDENFFKDHEELIRKYLTPTTPSKELVEYGDEIKKSNVIGVHVRRAEYGHHGVARMDYYRNCIKEIRRQCGDLPILVFTDEYNVCCFEFSRIGNLQVVKADTKNPYAEFYLLSKCKHFVLSNSSFSYWAAFFGERPDSMVYMPYPFCVFKPIEFLKSRAARWRIVDGAVFSA